MLKENVKVLVSSNEGVENMDKTIFTNIAFYLRVASAEIDEKGLLENLNFLLEVCNGNGWNATIYKDIIASGSTMGKLPEIQRLLRDAKKGLYDGVLVLDAERVSRGDWSY
ncbi:recombinase family protein [Clostridium estertheticum]|uniref:recombinase family protein n=1 Tax=Clostridium estertheticum TaxID=238834 RepID=UPI0013E97011|nr:recombinase family protein [Clostridium estertheticum]MBZ9688452.1 recombinase family protein [Clostridium estertheticum]